LELYLAAVGAGGAAGYDPEPALLYFGLCAGGGGRGEGDGFWGFFLLLDRGPAGEVF